MSEKRCRKLVSTVEQAIDNIKRFACELSGSQVIESRLGYVQSWYAISLASGGWIFAPSKFVGYLENTAEKYLTYTSPPFEYDGRETERALGDWFETVDPETRLGRELHLALEAFLAKLGKQPNSRARINLPKSELPSEPLSGQIMEFRYQKRISMDPSICGGRPCIKGSRMRVSDLLQMMADGATREEICEDFPYIEPEDITAALLFAARASEHRVIRAA
ncbi:MAG: DUF433 domain-containing protein [Amphiplicatus sp.]|nr:DUF433 domain-containing protein [Amphiplicatus sp.]